MTSTFTVPVATNPSNRKEIAEAFGNNQSAVRRIENITKDVTVNLPDSIVNSAALAQQALTLAQALQQVAYVLVAPSPTVPHADVLQVGTGLTLTIAGGNITLAISIPVEVINGGTGAKTAAGARANLGAAASGANSDITSLTGITTPLAATEGGTGVATLTPHGVVLGNGGGPMHVSSAGTSGQMLLSGGSSADPAFGSSPTIIGGTIDSAPIGATTPAAAAFTAVSAGIRTNAAAADAMLPTDYTVKENASAAAITYTLGLAASNTGRIVFVKKIDASANIVTVKAAGLDLIDGSNTYPLTAQWAAVQLQSDGTTWAVI